MEPYKFWYGLPRSIRKRLRDSPIHDVGRRANDWLWRTDWYAHFMYDFTVITVSFDTFETTLCVPKSEEPWWREYERYDCHEPLTSRTFMKQMEEQSTVWDMGSRLGYFATLGAEMTGTPDRVHVFETSISRCRLIEETNNERFGGKMHVRNTAIGDTDTNRVLTGDTYAKRHGPPDMVKIDIEGAEVAAVRGMEQTIESFRPTLIIEGHPELIENRDDGATDEDLLGFLDQYYNDISIAFDFRSPSGTWSPVERQWDERFEIRDLPNDEYDLYQLLCVP